MRDYIYPVNASSAPTAGFARFMRGHWNRSETKETQNLINAINTPGLELSALKKMIEEFAPKDPSLQRRKAFILMNIDQFEKVNQVVNCFKQQPDVFRNEYPGFKLPNG